jgi:hypothetical protein
MKKILHCFFLGLFTISLSIPAFAGKNCEITAQKTNVVEVAVKSAVNLHDILDQTGAKVVLISRVGKNLSQYGIKYSHVGFAYKTPNNVWQIFHELNSCGSDQSSLYIEGLANFFLDDMFSYDSKIFIPSESVQNNLYTLLVEQPESVKSLHENHYNMLAWPFSTKYQNSNQWVLEVVAQALSSDSSITNREQAQEWLKNNGFKPHFLELGTFTRLGARIFKENIAFDDQPFNQRMAGHIGTITVDSVFDFISKKDTQGNFIEVNNL